VQKGGFVILACKVLAMESVIFTSDLPVSAADAYAWHARPGAFARLQPPWEESQLMRVEPPSSGLVDGARWTIRTKVLGPKHMDYIAELHGVEPGVKYEDREIHGPFAAWNHEHRFVATGATCRLEDRIQYRLPFLPFSLPMTPSIRARLQGMFAYRHRLTIEDLKRHEQISNRPRLHVAMTGSRGLIGRELVAFLTSGGHRVTRLVNGQFQKPQFDDGTTWTEWNPQAPLPAGTLHGVDALVNLAGDGIATGRWTAAKKQRLRDSRVTPTKHLADAVARDGVPTFLSGSAIGIYGHRGDETLDETAAVGEGFLAKLAHDWEESAFSEHRTPNTEHRVVLLRTGIVLSPRGGALAKQLLPFKLGGGAVLGDGRQWMAWIDIQDMVYAIHHILMTPTICGPVNLTAPEPTTNRDFGRALAMVLKRPYLLTAPSFALRILFGQMADDAILSSTRVLPSVLQQHGYEFFQPRLQESLRLMLNR
jgi:hypothetical protein